MCTPPPGQKRGGHFHLDGEHPAATLEQHCGSLSLPLWQGAPIVCFSLACTSDQMPLQGRDLVMVSCVLECPARRAEIAAIRRKDWWASYLRFCSAAACSPQDMVLGEANNDGTMHTSKLICGQGTRFLCSFGQLAQGASSTTFHWRCICGGGH